MGYRCRRTAEAQGRPKGRLLRPGAGRRKWIAQPLAAVPPGPSRPPAAPAASVRGVPGQCRLGRPLRCDRSSATARRTD
eukprot:661663-Lingulodinium_polyedra.AAC.1